MTRVFVQGFSAGDIKINWTPHLIDIKEIPEMLMIINYELMKWTTQVCTGNNDVVFLKERCRIL